MTWDECGQAPLESSSTTKEDARNASKTTGIHRFISSPGKGRYAFGACIP
jgi:hypothetical protein